MVRLPLPRCFLAGPVIFLAALINCGPLSASAARPNVLLVCVDDLKPTLGCYGDRLAQTPNIDRLAARGAVLESAGVPDDAYPDGQIATKAVERLRVLKEKGTPFFLAVGFLKPHLPFCAPKKYWDLYDPARFPLPGRRTAPDGAPPFAPQ